MSFLHKHWLKGRRKFFMSITCVACEALCDLLQPTVMAVMIDTGISNLDLGLVLRYGLLMLSITLVGACFAAARNILSSTASQNFGADMRLELFTKIQKLSITDAETFDGGSLVTRMTNDISQMTNFVNSLMRVFIKAPVLCIGSIIIAAQLNIRTVPIVIGVVAVAIGSILLSMKFSYPVFARVQDKIDKMNTTVREYLIGIRLVRAFGRYDFERERFENANGGLSSETVKANRILGAFSPIPGFAAHMGIALVILFGARWAGAGDMHVGQITAFITYMTQILQSFTMISNILNQFVRTKASYARIAEVIALPDSEDIDYITKPDEEQNDVLVKFDKLTFSYPYTTGEASLQDISFELKRGETLGIIGPTGSGKSTLASLLLRFYDAGDGSLSYNGRNILDIPVKQLRERVAIVPQSAMLFTRSIKENILLGDMGASDEEVLEAAETAQAAEFINASRLGYDSPLGQSGINLSGGQKQRVSIARALVSKPELLILDDCTSAVDALTEARIQKSLKDFSKNLSCIMISQRISTVMRTDKILVLDRGRVAGLGSHEELLESSPVYRDIYVSQMGKAGV